MSANLPRQWLNKANEDLAVARLVFNEGHTAHTCFLSQQCMEKAFKAYLLNRANAYPRTHKLVDLLEQCALLDPAFSELLTDCIIVDQYYIPTRYPDSVPGSTASGAPSLAEAHEALSAAEKILRFVTAVLP